MAIRLYDLAGAGGCRFSPYCWRARMALAHKGLDVETEPVRFTDVRSICDGAQTTVPVIEDGGRLVRDSFDIALYLEETYPDGPSLFGGKGGQMTARFIEAWANSALNAGLITLVIHDLHDRLDPADRAYFRESREKRFGKSLERVQEGREGRVEGVRKSLTPLRLVLKAQPYIGGDAPLFADYIVFGSLQWCRVMSPFPILESGDPVAEWFGRLLDIHGGIGRAQAEAA